MDLDKASKYSHIGTFFLTAVLVVLTIILVWPFLRPDTAQTPSSDQGGVAVIVMTVLVLTGLLILGGGILNILATRNKQSKPQKNGPSVLQGIDPETHKKVVDKLSECESTVRHWQDEVRRVDVTRIGEKETLEKLWKESEEKANTLEQRFQLAQSKLDEFTTPRGRLKINRARYWAKHPETGEIKDVDVTEILDRLVLDEKLILSEIYQVMFPDPLRHVRKNLTIEFSHGNREFSITMPESTKLTLPFPYDDIPFPG